MLVVSDHIDGFLLKLVQILETRGFTTQIARNQRETLSIFVNKMPCVALVDYDAEVKWIMKSTLQMLTLRPKARVIVLLPESKVIREAERLGVELFFNKQSEPEELALAIRAVSRLRRQMTTWVER